MGQRDSPPLVQLIPEQRWLPVIVTARYFASENNVLIDVVEQHDRDQETNKDNHENEGTG